MTPSGVISLTKSPHSCTFTGVADDRKEIDWYFNLLLGYQGVLVQRDRSAVKMGSHSSLCNQKSRRNFEEKDKRTNLSFASSVVFTRVNTLGYYKIAKGDMSNSPFSSLFLKGKCACSRMTLSRLAVSRGYKAKLIFTSAVNWAPVCSDHCAKYTFFPFFQFFSVYNYVCVLVIAI